MNEQSWLESEEPYFLLQHVRNQASQRKLYLFAVACCQRVWHLLLDSRSKELVHCLEQYAEGSIDQDHLARVARQAESADWDLRCGREKSPSFESVLKAKKFASSAVLWTACPERNFNSFELFTRIYYTSADAAEAVAATPCFLEGYIASKPAECKLQSHLFRDIFGNPFRRIAFEPSWLTWNNGTISHMVQSIYNTSAYDQLPILADALEEAGCTAMDILAHCRGRERCAQCLGIGTDHWSGEGACSQCNGSGWSASPGLHVRGCWVVDMLLGKE